MTWWRRNRGNLLGLAALLGLVPLAVWATYDDSAFLLDRTPRVPVVADSEDTVNYGGAALALAAFTPLESLPSPDGQWSPPAGYRLWSATMSVELADPAVPIESCEVSLEDRAGIIVNGSPVEVSGPTGGSSFTSCEPDDVAFDEPRPPLYEFEIPFLTAHDFVPAAVRLAVPGELPRYASFPVPPAGAGD